MGMAQELREAPQALAPTPGARSILVCAVDSLDAVPALVAPHAAFLQTAGLACEPQRIPNPDKHAPVV